MHDKMGGNPLPSDSTLTLDSQRYIQQAAQYLTPNGIVDDQLQLHTALILYSLEHDVQCRLEHLISPYPKVAVDLSKFARPSELTEVSIQSS